MKDVITLAIESSCDETSASILKNGRDVLSNIISTQIETHKKFGGVVPEVASRKHIENIDEVVQEETVWAEEANARREKRRNIANYVAVTVGLGALFFFYIILIDFTAVIFTFNSFLKTFDSY